jgi:hypothetical protein
MFNPFDRPIINPRERPLSTDINELASDADRSFRDTLLRMFSGRTSIADDACLPKSGFLGCGFKVQPVSPIAMQVKIRAGIGFVYDASSVPSSIDGIAGLADLSSYKPVLLVADALMAVPAAPGVGFSRKDIIEVKVDRRRENPLTRPVLDVGTGVFNPSTVNKTLAFALDGRTGTVNDPNPSTTGIGYKVGQAALTGAETEPAVTSGYVKIATILVGPSVVTIDEYQLIDWRRMIYHGGVATCSLEGVEDNAVAPKGTLGILNAPPGVRVAILGTGFTQTTVYVIAGGYPAIVGPTPSGHRSPTVWGGTTCPGVLMAGTISLVQQSNLANPAVCSPAIKAAVGQPYQQFDLYHFLWSAPAIIAANASMIFQCRFGLQS